MTVKRIVLCRTCGQQSSYTGVDRHAAAAAATVNVAAADGTDGGGMGDNRWNCLCDDQCATYGDCCTDWPLFDPVEQQRAAARYACVRTGGGGVYAVAGCPDAWTDRAVRRACETAGGLDRDGMLDNPVTGRSTGRTYRNRFCAVCNGDAADSVVWDTRIVCDDLLDMVNGSAAAAEAVADTLRRGDNGRWTVEFRGRSYDCRPTVVPPTPIQARPCQPDVVSACLPGWPDGDVRSNCGAYTTVVYNVSQPYKNAHCAICNNVPVQNLTCDAAEVHYRFPWPAYEARSFTALFRAQPGHRKCRGDDKFYDPFGKTCRPLVPTADGVTLGCASVAVYLAPPANWLPSNVGDAGAGAVGPEYVTLDNGTIVACADGTPDGSSAEEFRSAAALTYAGLGVSVVFLLMHLAVFAALPDMKNLSGKNLASFCVSLVCSYAAFAAGNWLTGPACYAGAAFTYYAFLTSFAWMLVMGFDCWRTLRLATVKLRVTAGRQTKKFVAYSAVCWLVPAMLTFVAVAADAVPAVPDQYRPRFGADQCWFGSKAALLVFFVVPLAAVMTVNFTLFAWTAYMIHSSRATVRHVNTRHARRDFRMYCRLAVLMGLTWTTGILASYTDKRYLWVVFVALNTFQGLFVFVAFTCRRRILNALVGGVRGGGGGGGVVGGIGGSVNGGGGGGGINGGRGYSSSSVDPEKDSADIDGRSRRNSPPTSSFTWSSSTNNSGGGGGGGPIVVIGTEKTSDSLY